MSDIEVEPYYQRKAQELMDLLIDKSFMREDLSREETRILENYLAEDFQATANSIKRTAELMRKYKNKNEA